MKYCKRCVLPESHESIQFDEDGICNICHQAEIKHHSIDWDARRAMLDAICNRYRNRGQYDCIIPFSGGKDSTFQLWVCCNTVKNETSGCAFQSLGLIVLSFTKTISGHLKN